MWQNPVSRQGLRRTDEPSSLTAATTTTTRRCTSNYYSSMRWHLLPLLLASLVLLVLLTRLPGAESRHLLHRRFNRQSVRLCSHSLSDALYMLCHERGYNEPFGSSSSEDGVPHTTGPGLVDECCYNSCSIEQLEQYCKPKQPAD